MADFEELLGPVRVIPVITVNDIAAAVPLAQALVDGGLPLLEVTLRTACGLEAIRLIADEVPGVIVGAGTVINADQYAEATAAGARFIVSPGCSDALAAEAAARGAEGPVFLPGAVTASEVMALLERGITTMKFFPAAASGGVQALKALAGPFPQVRFCPTGGITLERAPDYLGLGNVICVGGSWMVPAELVADGDWEAIRTLAAQTAERTPCAR